VAPDLQCRSRWREVGILGYISKVALEINMRLFRQQTIATTQLETITHLHTAFATYIPFPRTTMRSLLALLALPALTLAAPPESPRITKIVFSGSGCPNDSGSVKSDTITLGDNAGVSFSQLKGTDTDNCAVHIQSTGGSPGWQVAVQEITYEGDVNLRGNSQLDTYTQIFWSENAGSTVSLT